MNSMQQRKPFSRRRNDARGKSRRARGLPPEKRGGNDPFAFTRMKRGAKKQKAQRGIDTALFVRKAIEKTEAVAYHPEHRFADFAVHDAVKRNIVGHGYEHPTPIQDGAIPVILKGRDVVGVANTGTGKTAAFLIPLIDKCFRDRKERVIILVPTRELAMQIDEEFRAFSGGLGLASALTIGGMRIDRQARDVRRNPAFVIGTPGRVKDLIEQRILDLSKFGNVVLDEVDRMLDMGFVRDIRYLLSLTSEKRQTLFFSATMPREAKELSMKFLSDPVTITIPSSRATSENVNQDVVRVGRKEDKIEILHELLLKPEFKKTLIFTRTKYGASKLARNLAVRGFSADAIHGDLGQGQRKRALEKFRDGRAAVLVATDVAARGLDIGGVSHVINYDIPGTYEDYIHRIGRTGRGHEVGSAVTFIEEFGA